MFTPMLELDEGRATAGFREWAPSSSEEAGGGGLAVRPRKGWAARYRAAVATGRRCGTGIGRPICVPRLDLLAKPWAPVPDLVQLEPLTEP